MSLPPPPDPFGPGQGSGSSQGGPWPGQPTWGTPQQHSAPGPFPAGPPPGGQPQWGSPQQGWSPPQPPQKGGGLKWLLIAVAVLLVIAISVGATLLFTRDGDGGNKSTAAPTQTSGAAGDIASANDTGPVSIITEDPTCPAWGPIVNTLSAAETNGWDKRDPAIPASRWTTDQRSLYDRVGQAMRSSADQIVNLARLTPHRVMRELYEQQVAYLRAYAQAIPDYQAVDDNLAMFTNTAASSINAICAAIDYESAAARAPLAAPAPPPTRIAPIGDPAKPQMFLTPPPSPVCPDLATASAQFLNDSQPWRNTDANIPATDWSAEQQLINDQVAGVMLSFADRIEALGQQSDNPIFEDFAFLAVQYRRAYVQSLSTYTPNDNFLSQASSQLVFMINRACSAAES
jgi:hypothetical protein